MNRKKHTLIYEKVNLTQNLNTTPLDVTGLDGDSWDYMVEWSIDETVTNSSGLIRLNGDSTSNYRDYHMQVTNSSVYGFVSETQTQCELYNYAFDKKSICRFSIKGESGSERFIDSFSAGATSQTQLFKKSAYWKNTADNLTSIQFLFQTSTPITFTIRIYQIPKKANLDNYDLVEAVDFSARNLLSSPIVFDNLNGDSDGEYLVEWLGLSQFPQLQLNSITGYTVQELRNNNGTIQAQNYSETESWTYGGLEGCSTIDAVSGRKRLIKSTLSNRVFASQQFEVATWCNNTADEITSITFSTDVATTTDGSVKLYRRKSNKTIDPVPMETLVEYDIAGVDFSAGITITGLQGDRINGAMKIEFVGTGNNCNLRCNLNNDYTVNYPYQRLSASGAGVSAGSGTFAYNHLADPSTGDTFGFETYVYPQSGQNRPILTTNRFNTSVTQHRSSWWNNTADEINRIDIYSQTTNPITGTIRISVPKGTKMASPSAIVTVN